MNHLSNGRVDIMNPEQTSCFALSDKIPIKASSSFRDAMTGNWYDTILSQTFFSKENIEILQNGIRAGVYKRSNGQYFVGRQNEDELKIIMRSIFLQYTKNDAQYITKQISSLNKLVLDFAVSQVYGEANGYMRYKFDASTLVVPLSTPIMSKTNDKQLQLKHWF